MLTSSTDLDLINRIKEEKDIETSLAELIRRHSGIYLNIVARHLSGQDNINIRHDVSMDKDLVIWNAALKFDEAKNVKFCTYVGSLAKWACLTALKHKKAAQNDLTDSINYDTLIDDCDRIKGELNAKKEILAQIKEKVQKMPDDRIEKIFHLRYEREGKTMSWKKIGRELGISYQCAINIHKAALKKLINREYNVD